ncbi:YodC family protein [Erwinia amylovora]|uniref:YodC family protein n=1 Tax=Erwinia amylovora TaxID=552 RepID=UPI001443C670|nr:DUF2158 domain-containing protein [Erwinia amylovora]
MNFTVSDEVQHKEGGPAMIVTDFSSGMVECRWYDGFSVRREAYRAEELLLKDPAARLVS